MVQSNTGGLSCNGEMDQLKESGARWRNKGNVLQLTPRKVVATVSEQLRPEQPREQYWNGDPVGRVLKKYRRFYSIKVPHACPRFQMPTHDGFPLVQKNNDRWTDRHVTDFSKVLFHTSKATGRAGGL